VDDYKSTPPPNSKITVTEQVDDYKSTTPPNSKNDSFMENYL